MRKAFLPTIISLFLYQATIAQDPIAEIRSLYKDYNDNLTQMDNYEIKFNTPGSFPSMIHYTDHSGKLLVKTSDSDEFGSSNAEYYFKNDTLVFLHFISDRLITHWGAEVVKFQKLEMRFYLDKGKVIKTLKKSFTGIEGKDDDFDFGTVPNQEINYQSDPDANWTYFDRIAPKIISLSKNLNDIF